MSGTIRLAYSIPLAIVFAIVAACSKPQPGHVLDEARLAGRAAASFPHAGEDFFHEMDRGVALTPEEVKGRNMWLVWTGGNDRLWDLMTDYTFGAFDLLKAVSSHPQQGFSRNTRWEYLGLVNEPCFEQASAPDPTRFNLWIDVRGKDCAPDPFEDEKKYPGVAIGARGKSIGDGKTLPVGSYYGYATGIVGLRLFPNPAFDAKAAKEWDAQRYYTDPSYYNRKDLVRPYRVGMSCGFCHVGPNPINPPADPTHPKWENLDSAIGAQYMWVDRLFIFGAANEAGRRNFMYQLVHTFRPGAMDTSLISTDNINNPRTMNAVYDLASRMGMAKRIGQETLGGGELNNKQLNDFFPTGPLSEFFTKPDQVLTPRVLKDGSDSVGVMGALNRVYLNIGLFSEEWLLHFNPVLGGKPISPILIADAQKNSSYWQATELGTPATALFFLKATPPDHLKDAPGGDRYLTTNKALLDRGKNVFADTCARCHSSKAPPPPEGLDPAKCQGPGYLDCFKRYWAHTQTDDFKKQMRVIVNAPDFLENNYLSTDARVPVTLLRTNACSPLATNALQDNIWDNFSSHTYKALPSIGKITLHDPFTGAPFQYAMPAGGRGYTRVPSLISAWSTAPFLLNNSVGPFESSPSVEGRLKSFQASIEQMLWPEKRQRDDVVPSLPGVVDRTTVQSELTIPAGYVPETLRPLQGAVHRFLPWLSNDSGDITLGRVPKGVPVNLLANLDPLTPPNASASEKLEHAEKLLSLLRKMQGDVASLPPTATDDELMKKYANLKDSLLALSKCPDFVVNRGHYFGTTEFNRQDGLTDDEKSFGKEPELTDDDRRALIEFIKTF